MEPSAAPHLCSIRSPLEEEWSLLRSNRSKEQKYVHGNFLSSGSRPISPLANHVLLLIS